MPWPMRFGPEPRMITAGSVARHAPRSPRRRTSSGTASGRRTRRRRCRRSCRPGGCRARAAAADDVLGHAAQLADLAVGEAVPLGPAQQRRGRARRRRATSSATSLIRQIWSRNHGSMPVASCTASSRAPARSACCTSREPAVVRDPHGGQQRVDVDVGTARRSSENDRIGLLQRAQRLLQRLGEVAADRHRLADRLHVRGQRRVGGRELLEREPRHLDHDVVEGRLEGRRGLAR